MAIFKKSSKVCNKAITVLENNKKAIKSIYALSSFVEDVIDMFDNFISKFGKVIKNGGKTVEAVSKFIGENPFFTGPWKFVAKILSRGLLAIAKIIQTVGNAIDRIGKTINKNRKSIKYLEELAEKFNEILVDLATINSTLIQHTNTLKAISDKLEEQQKDIEKAIPGLYGSVSPTLDSIDVFLTAVLKFQNDIKSLIDPIQKEIDQIKNTIKSLSPLNKLLKGFADALKPFRDIVDYVVEKIKEVMSYLSLDKAMEKIEEGIKWLMDITGLSAVIDAAAERVKALPFVKKLLELQKEALRIVSSLGKALVDAISSATKMLDEFIQTQTEALGVLGTFLRLAVTKVDIEAYLPFELQKLLEELRKLKKKVEEDGDLKEGQWKKLWGEQKSKVQQLQAHTSTAAITPFGGEVYISVQNEVAAAATISESISLRLNRETASEGLDGIIHHIDNAYNSVIDFGETVSLQSGEYYAELQKLNVELKERLLLNSNILGQVPKTDVIEAEVLVEDDDKS